MSLDSSLSSNEKIYILNIVLDQLVFHFVNQRHVIYTLGFELVQYAL